MNIKIYYGGRGIMGDPTIHVVSKLQEVLEELHVKVERINLYEKKREISALPGTLNDADGIVLASTVEWYGMGGLMLQFLDACYLYGNKEKISNIYMCPIVMSTCYGEREAKSSLSIAWETLGGRVCSGLCGYVSDPPSFELNTEYNQLIEKKAENLYRTISQKVVSLPASSYSLKEKVNHTAQIPLTPQETEQLSKYVSDDEYVKTQKEDIKELSSHFKNLLGSAGSDEDRRLMALKEHFVPQKGIEASYKMMIEGEKNSIIIRIKDDTLAVEYGNIENPSVLCKLKNETIDEIIAGRMTFQRAFMSSNMQVKGDLKVLRMLDQIFVFGN